MEISLNYGEVQIVGGCNEFQIFSTNMIFEVVLRRVYRVLGFENNLIITYRQTTFLIHLSINFLEKISDIWLFSCFLFFPVDIMVNLPDRLHISFPKFRIKAKFLQHFCSSSYFFYQRLSYRLYFTHFHFILIWDNISRISKNFVNDILVNQDTLVGWQFSIKVNAFMARLVSTWSLQFVLWTFKLVAKALTASSSSSYNSAEILPSSAMALVAASLDTPNLWKQFVKVFSRSVIQVFDNHIMADRINIAGIEALFPSMISVFLPPMTDILPLKHEWSLAPLTA